MTVPERPELQKSGGSVTRPDREHMSADAGEERDVERVAWAICSVNNAGHEEDMTYTAASMGEPAEPYGPRWTRYMDEARAAITAYTSCSGRDREGVEAALKRFQYAVSWVASDSWDHCGECRDRLEWAQSMAGEPLSFDEKSTIAKDYLRYSGTSAIRALSRK